MPARTVPLISGQTYHIFNRGINKQSITKGIRDYRRILELIKFYQYVKPPLRYSKFLLLAADKKISFWDSLKNSERLVSVNCYCLMPNHFHLLLEQLYYNGISTYMSNVQNSYTRYFNTKYACQGPLLQGQFKVVRIEDDNQLLHISRYIHLNPYTSFVVKTTTELINYPWSSIQEYVSPTSGFCTKERILDSFKTKKAYESFVLDQADYQRELDLIKHLTIEEQ